ncbi:MAG: hypothetical protein KGI90_09405 [Burkholderiales bacterium]|nr:hypothetical protein [Burkholderiales bacterium]
MTPGPPRVHSAACGCPRHTIHHAQGHLGWDTALPPVLRVVPGEAVAFEVFEASGWGWAANIPASGCWPTRSRSRRCSSGPTTPARWRRRCSAPGAGCR